MPVENWDDLRILLAAARSRGFADAARRLRLDATTVARRLERLERRCGAKLVLRDGGALTLTDRGAALARCAEAAERAVAAGDAGLSTPYDGAGVVRITATPLLVNAVLAPQLAPFLDAHPRMTIELAPDGRDLDLARREADLALRLARPKVGGARVVAQRIADLPYAAYAGESAIGDGPWIRYDDDAADRPQAVWLDAAAAADRQGESGLRVHDGATALEAAAAGLGRTILPRAIADRDRRLRRIEVAAPPPAREVWLLTNAERADDPPTMAASGWLRTTVRGHLDARSD